MKKGSKTGRRKSTVKFDDDNNNQEESQPPQNTNKRGVDAVTMTLEEEFPVKSGSYSPLLSRGDANQSTGSNFIKNLMKRKQMEADELAKNEVSFGTINEEPKSPAEMQQSISGEFPQQDPKSPKQISGAITIASRRSSIASGLGLVATPPSSHHHHHAQQQQKRPFSSRSEQSTALLRQLTEAQQQEQYQLHLKQHGPRRMMRPSEVENPSLFPKMKIVGVDDDDSDLDEEAKKIVGGNKKTSKVAGDQDGTTVVSSQQEQQQQNDQEAEKVDQEERLLKSLQQESRLRKAVTLPDEVLTLVRKLRSAADIIGSSEGAPPPDSLREVAVHSASLARFVSTWTLKQLAEREAHETSLNRQWLSDAARELKAKAEDFSWSTATNSPILSHITNKVQQQHKTQKTQHQEKVSAKTSASTTKEQQQDINNPYVWQKSYAAITANLGPWILSTLYLIMDSLLHTIQCDRGAIFVPDDTGKVVSVCLVGAGGIARPIRVNRGHGVVGEVFRSGVAVNVLSTEAAQKRSDEIFSRDVDNTTGFFTRNLLAVPVFDVGADLVTSDLAETKRKQQQEMMRRRGSQFNPTNKAQQEQLERELAEQDPERKRMEERRNAAALVGRAKVVAVIQLLNKLVPANGEFTPADELLVAQVGSVVASMIAACGGILQLGTETALKYSSELQAKLLAMRPAVVKARRQFLTATSGGCDSENTSTGKYSFTQVLNLHEEQRARERNIALMLEQQTSATDLSRCGATNEKIQQISTIGGASTKVLRIGGDGGKNTEVERALQDMASFVGRIEAAWAGTRERCVMAEAEAAASREAYLKLEAELLDLRRLANACGILKGAQQINNNATTNNNIVNRQSSRAQSPISRVESLASMTAQVEKEERNTINNYNNNRTESPGISHSSAQRVSFRQQVQDRLQNNNNSNNRSGENQDGGDVDSTNERNSQHSSFSNLNNPNGGAMTDDQAILERLLHAGDPSGTWESSQAAFLDFFQGRTAGYRKAAAIENVQARNLAVMRARAATSTVGKTMKELADISLVDRLMRCGDPASLLQSATSTRHRHRMHHNRTIKEKAEVDPLSLSCQKLKEHVAKQEKEMAELIAKQQEETRNLYLELLSHPSTNGVKDDSLYEDTGTSEHDVRKKQLSEQKERQEGRGRHTSAKRPGLQYNNGVDAVGDVDVEAENVGFRLLAQEFTRQKGLK